MLNDAMWMRVFPTHIGWGAHGGEEGEKKRLDDVMVRISHLYNERA